MLPFAVPWRLIGALALAALVLGGAVKLIGLGRELERSRQHVLELERSAGELRTTITDQETTIADLRTAGDVCTASVAGHVAAGAEWQRLYELERSKPAPAPRVIATEIPAAIPAEHCTPAAIQALVYLQGGGEP